MEGTAYHPNSSLKDTRNHALHKRQASFWSYKKELRHPEQLVLTCMRNTNFRLWIKCR